MRWSDLRTWEAMIDAATRIHDGIYSPSSPTPVAKMDGCKDPTPQCRALALCAKTPKGFICTKPTYLPTVYIADKEKCEECPQRVVDWKEGGTAQSTSKEAKAPRIKDGKSAQITAWLTKTLDSLQDHGDVRVRMAAGMLLSDLDVSVSMDALQKTGELMLERLDHERPWEVKK